RCLVFGRNQAPYPGHEDASLNT
ncbi:MAG: hypothetical protein K0Q72_4056, partial [Armatimonadetes bacterium]|nr:hypothetical protein [Armatimonadota bacterium]